MRSELLLERLAATGFEGDLLRIAMETSCQTGETESGRHGHTVQLLVKGDDTTQLSAVFEADVTKTESCQQGKLPWLSAAAEVQRNSSSLGKRQRRNFSSMTKVLSLILAAAQHLDSYCSDCWNRAVHFGRPDLLEVCANSASPLVEAVESAGGEGLRTSFWNGYDLTTRRGRERLYQFCSTKKAKTRLVLFTLSSLWNIITTSVSYAGWNRSCGSESASTWLSRSFFAQPLRVSSWRQNSLMRMSEKMMNVVVGGCAWGLRVFIKNVTGSKSWSNLFFETEQFLGFEL